MGQACLEGRKRSSRAYSGNVFRTSQRDPESGQNRPLGATRLADVFALVSGVSDVWPGWDLSPDWSPETWTAVGTIVLAAATVFAVFAQDPVRRRYLRASVTMTIRQRPPDVHLIQMQFTYPDGTVLVEKVLYIRVDVSHEGGRTAENVELLAARVWRVSDDGERLPVTKFLPMPLLWSSSGGATTVRLPSGFFRHCDFGYLGRMGGHETKLTISTAVQPFGVGTEAESPSVLSPGTYDIEVVLSGDNVEPIHETWRIRFGPQWSDDEFEMLEKISITAQGH